MRVHSLITYTAIGFVFLTLGFLLGNFWPIFSPSRNQSDLTIVQSSPSPLTSPQPNSSLTPTESPLAPALPSITSLVAKNIEQVEPNFSFTLPTSSNTEFILTAATLLTGGAGTANDIQIPIRVNEPSGATVLDPNQTKIDGMNAGALVLSTKIRNSSRTPIFINLNQGIYRVFRSDTELAEDISYNNYIKIEGLSSVELNAAFAVPENLRKFQVLYGPLDNPTGALEVDFDNKSVTPFAG